MTLITVFIWIYALVALGLAVIGVWALRDAAKSIEAQDEDSDEAMRIMSQFESLSDSTGLTPNGIMVLVALMWPITLFGRSIK